MPQPSNNPVFRAHKHAHFEIIRSEQWYGDCQPLLGPNFTAAATAAYQQVCIEILARSHRRALRDRDTSLASAYRVIANKLAACKPCNRCGSLACPACRRAFQQAKAYAQRALLTDMKSERPNHRQIVMPTVVPLKMQFKPDELQLIDLPKHHRWLKDALRREGITRTIIGGADLSWEDGFWQLHWHLAAFTTHREGLREKLKAALPAEELDRYERPILISSTYDLNFSGYTHKVVRIHELLKQNRKQLPRLMLALDGIDPLDTVFLSGVRMSAQSGALIFKEIDR